MNCLKCLIAAAAGLLLWGCSAADDPADADASTSDIADADVTAEIPDGMVLVPEGPFWMGCNPDDGAGLCWGADPFPVHQVTLNSFFIDKTEVTHAAFQKCVDAGVCSDHLDDATCWFTILPQEAKQQGYVIGATWREPTRPMMCVDWEQARQYCEWAGKRLPTEAEWEKAARGDDSRNLPWGEAVAGADQAVCTGPDTMCCIFDTTSNVCSTSPDGDSPYGLCDMVGNVSEWVQDWLDGGYYQVSPLENPLGPDSGSARVIRGSSYFQSCLYVHSRFAGDPARAESTLGFRCAMNMVAE